MVAPTRVNEGAPQEPTPAGLTGDLTEPAPAEAAPAEAAPAEASAEAVPAEAGQAKTATAEAGREEAEPAGAGHADAASTETAHQEAEAAEAVPAETAPAETAPAGAEAAGAAGAGADAGQEDRAGEEGRDVGALAVVGIIVGVIVLVGVAAGVLAMITHGFKPKTVVTYRPAAVFGLRPGQCVNLGSSSLSFTLVSCANPHDAEVFASFSLPAAAWPGSAAVRQQAGDGCASRLSGYLNPQLATIGLTQEYVYPNQEAWQAGQRTVVCEVSAGSGPLTGSVRAKH
jgi:hypothetical protein